MWIGPLVRIAAPSDRPREGACPRTRDNRGHADPTHPLRASPQKVLLVGYRSSRRASSYREHLPLVVDAAERVVPGPAPPPPARRLPLYVQARQARRRRRNRSPNRCSNDRCPPDNLAAALASALAWNNSRFRSTRSLYPPSNGLRRSPLMAASRSDPCEATTPCIRKPFAARPRRGQPSAAPRFGEGYSRGNTPLYRSPTPVPSCRLTGSWKHSGGSDETGQARRRARMGLADDGNHAFSKGAPPRPQPSTPPVSSESWEETRRSDTTTIVVPIDDDSGGRNVHLRGFGSIGTEKRPASARRMFTIRRRSPG